MLRVQFGFFYAIWAAALFGASTPAAKWLLQGTSPWLLAGLLYSGSGIGLFLTRAVMRYFRGPAAEAPLRGRDWIWMAGATVFGGVLGPVLLMMGLARSDSASASLLLNLESLATALLAWFVFNENFDKRILLGMLSILAGSLVLSWTGVPGIQGYLGPLCIAAACLCWGIDNNLTKQIAAGDAMQIAMIKGTVAGVTNVALAIVFNQASFQGSTLLFAGVVGYLGYGVSLLCFVLALRYIGAARTGAYFALAPFVGATIAVAIGQEPLSWQLGMAIILMAVGVWCHVAEKHEHEHIHEVMDHEHSHIHDEHHQHKHGPDDPVGEKHSHRHRHERMVHSHPHFPDSHHTHSH